MAGQTFNWIADKLLIQKQQNNIDLGRLRAFRRFDRNNYENVVNSVTGRVGSASQRLAIAQGLGLQTQGLIIGGQRDGGVGGGSLSERVRGKDPTPDIYGQQAFLRERAAAQKKRDEKGAQIRRERAGTGLPAAPITPE